MQSKNLRDQAAKYPNWHESGGSYRIPASRSCAKFGAESAGENAVEADPVPGRCPSASACKPWRECIELGLSRGRHAKAVWQDLVDDHGFTGGYQSVRRLVGKLRRSSSPEARVVITTSPGGEAQVDYGSGPMVGDPQTGKVSPDAVVRTDARLQQKVGSLPHVPLQRTYPGRVA